jgi:hypothetical protein
MSLEVLSKTAQVVVEIGKALTTRLSFKG